MSRRTYEVTLDRRTRHVVVEHGYWSARRVVRVDGVERFRSSPRSFRELTDLWQTSTEQPFDVDGHTFVLRVSPGLATYHVELVVDGRSLEDGLPAGPLRASAFPPYGWTVVKMLVALIALVVYDAIVVIPLGIYAREQGGFRWIIGANALFDLTLPLAAFVLVVFAWQSRLRGRNVALALALFAAVCAAFPLGFVEAADVFAPFDEETIEFHGWRPGGGLRTVTELDGAEFNFANDTKIRWRRFPPGTYAVLRGHFSRVVLDMREVTSARR